MGLEDLQVARLYGRQGLPARRLTKGCQGLSTPCHVGEGEALASEFVVQGCQKLAERAPGEQVMVSREMTGEMRQDARIGVTQGFNPGKLLRQGIRHRPLRLVEEFRELSNGHKARRHQYQSSCFGLVNEDFEQTPPSPCTWEHNDCPL
jgi:hypothetical protein